MYVAEIFGKPPVNGFTIVGEKSNLISHVVTKETYIKKLGS